MLSNDSYLIDIMLNLFSKLSEILVFSEGINEIKQYFYSIFIFSFLHISNQLHILQNICDYFTHKWFFYFEYKKRYNCYIVWQIISLQN